MDMDRIAPGLERLIDKDAPMDRISYGTTFAEGPVWDRRNKQLYWVDIIGNTIFDLFLYGFFIVRKYFIMKNITIDLFEHIADQ